MIGVLLSGGLDSTVLLHHVMNKEGKENVIAFTFKYGQKHDKEVVKATEIANACDVQHRVIAIPVVYEKNTKCTLLKGNADVPKGAYEGKNTTEVPFRNQLMLTIAAAQEEVDTVTYAGHLNDENAAYVDCSLEFYKTMSKLLGMQGVTLYAPFIDGRFTKKQIVAEGIALGVDMENTWSCYEGKEKPCGKCATCIDRQNSMAQ